THVDPGLTISAAAVNAMRRDVLNQLTALRARREEHPLRKPKAVPQFKGPGGLPGLTIQVTTREQLTPNLLSLETAMLYADRSGRFSYKFNDKDFRVDTDDMRDIYTGHVTMDTVSMTNLKEMYIRCALTMNERWDSGKSYAPTHGIRRTEILGYQQPAEFYSPLYPDNMDDDIFEDNRRTFYWNPDVTTDANGEATIECSNSRNTTYMNVSAETLWDGRPAAVNFNTYSAGGH
ncbi:MAG: hypothetical protein ACI3YB_04745, partial [Prevotella sp.]